MAPGQAQSANDVETQEDAIIQQFSLPEPAPQAPVVQPRPQAPARRSPTRSAPASRPAAGARPDPSPSPQPASPPAASEEAPEVAQSEEDNDAGEATTPPLSQYNLQFNRAPVVGNALQLEGVLSQARIGFTRPRHWQVESAKVQLKFRHSPALYAERSNLTVRLNNIYLGSVPLNRAVDDIGNVLFDIPEGAIQDYNTVVMQVQQHTSPDCTDPTDPALWTEILPDSAVIINYVPQEIALDLANYPYPFLDELSLDADRLTYVEPEGADDAWATAAARYQASAARLTSFRSVKTRLVKDIETLEFGEKLVVIGTPEAQPLLSELDLPFDIRNNKVVDGGGNALPNDVGVVMVTATSEGNHPVLVATGNDAQGVLKAVQALVQPGDRQILTGQGAIVSDVSTVESPQPDNWKGFIPQDTDQFKLSDLVDANLRPFSDITVNGLPVPPAIQIPFKALPDDQFLRGSTFTLRYSYSPNVDPARSSVSVRVDGQALGGKRLQKPNGDTDSITLNIPPGLVGPTSNLEVQFFTYPRIPLNCGDIPDQPMWGTVHGDSSFNLNRTSFVELPDLEQMQVGYPLTAPQDLSQLTFVLPELPTTTELLTLLQASGRFGRLSEAESVKLEAYSATTIPENIRQESNLVGIGSRNRFPLPELFEGSNSFSLGEQLLRRQGQSQVQVLPDQAGLIEAAVSPWNSERILVGLTGQSEAGLEDVQQVLFRDDLFSRLSGDTLLVQRTTEEPSLFTTDDYRVVTVTQSSPEAVDRRGPLTRVVALLQANWFLLPGGLLLVVLVFYAVSQLYLDRASRSEGA